MPLSDYVRMPKPPARPKTMFLISAQLQTGKDTLANAIVAAHGVRKVALADPVKEVAIAMIGMPSAVAYGGEAERHAWSAYGKDARQWLQWIGTELGRKIDENIWIHRLLERVSTTAADIIVVSDLRFTNEILVWPRDESLKPYFKFVTIRLKRPGTENSDPHPSEAEQLSIPDSEFSEVIINDKEPKDLEAHGKRLVSKWAPRY